MLAMSHTGQDGNIRITERISCDCPTHKDGKWTGSVRVAVYRSRCLTIFGTCNFIIIDSIRLLSRLFLSHEFSEFYSYFIGYRPRLLSLIYCRLRVTC